jgi:hypothetical protein
MFVDLDGRDPPFTGPLTLLRIKQTTREKDWPIVGELARLLTEPRDQLLHSRSARDLLELARAHPALAAEVQRLRPALRTLPRGLDELRLELERERFAAMDADQQRMRSYLQATARFEQHWAELARRTAGLPLRPAHALVVESAHRWLPTDPNATSS